MRMGRESGRDETVTNPDVQVGATRTDVRSASEEVSQSVETRLLRSVMTSRFLDIAIRGRRPVTSKNALDQITSRISKPGGLNHSTAQYTLF